MSDNSYRLGLDLGTNSVGWAAVKVDQSGNPCGVLGMGVRIFSDGLEPGDRPGRPSLAENRRLKRGMRRRRDRYLRRRSDLLQSLREFGLMPEDEESSRRIASIDPYPLRSAAVKRKLTPHELGRVLFHLDQRRGFKSNARADGGKESKAKEESDQYARIDALRANIRESGSQTLGEYMARLHAHGKPVRFKPGTDSYPDRALYEQEFGKVRDTQRPFHSLTEEDWDSLRQVIFHQRPLKAVPAGPCLYERDASGQPLPRAEKALPISQEFRMVQEVLNLRVRIPGEDTERPLNPDEVVAALRRLRSGKDINLQKPTKKDFGLPDGVSFTLARSGRKALNGDHTTKVLSSRDHFGDRWFTIPMSERTAIVKTLVAAERPIDFPAFMRSQWGVELGPVKDIKEVESALLHVARDHWGLDPAAALNVVTKTPLAKGYVRLSAEAISKILPFMENDGLDYANAVRAAGYAHHSDRRTGANLECLPYYGKVLELEVVGADPTQPESDGPARYGRIPNPTVHIGLGQVRHTVNKLIKRYGKPVAITVELARDLKMNQFQKEAEQKSRLEGEKRNERYEELCKSAGVTPSPHIRRKLRLWERLGVHELDRNCPYTGKQIGFQMAISEQTEIDHILAYSRTFDNAISNQVLCLREANRFKGERSPDEAFGHNPPGYSYEDVKLRARQIGEEIKKIEVGSPQERSGKANATVRRFMPGAMDKFADQDKFLDRQLNETQWLSVLARDYLAHLYDERLGKRQRVFTSSGRLTWLLRTGWGLNGLLDEKQSSGQQKRRTDHRHHSIDAFVIAVTTPSLVKQVADAAGKAQEDELRRIPKRLLPWDGFTRDDLRSFIESMVVSHRLDRGTPGKHGKTTGQLHNEKAYGIISQGDDTQPATVVVRRQLSGFKSRTNVEAVRDSALRDALLALWDRIGPPGGTPADFAHHAEHQGVQLNTRMQCVRSARVKETMNNPVVIRNQSGEPYKAYKPDANEFADIWHMPPYKPVPGTRKPRGISLGDRRWKTVIVSKFQANQPGFDSSQVRPDPAAKHLMRLHTNDMGAFGSTSEPQVVRVVKMSVENGEDFVYFIGHNEANADARVRLKQLKYLKKSAEQLRREGFRKVGVDHIGGVRDPGPRR